MATRALTPVARRRSNDDVSTRKNSGPARDWRQVLLSQDAEAIWHELFILARTAAPDHAAGYEQVTQDVFLELLATDRIGFYVERKYSDAEIEADLISMLGG